MAQKLPVILVGVDGSDASMGAVEWAAAQAKAAGWGIHLVCAYSLPSFAAATMDGGFAAIDESRIRASAEEVIDAGRARIPEGITVTHSIETSDPTTVLADMSRDAAMLVVGKRRGGGLADRILGAVSATLPPHAYCPTVVVPVPRDGALRVPIKRIVVGVDGSEYARAALDRAISEALIWDASVTAVSAVPLGTGGAALSWGLAPMDPDELLSDVQNGLDQIVDDALEAAGGRAAGLTIDRHALGGSPAALLTEFSSAVDLVVMGTRGRGGFRGLLLGSTSQTVIQHASAPVLIVPSKPDRHADLDAAFPWEV